MTKQIFLERVSKFAEYCNKIDQVGEILNLGYENLLQNIISEMGINLIEDTNPNLKGLHEDYFFETFWDNIHDFDSDDWAIFYDSLIEGVAPIEYIHKYS